METQRSFANESKSFPPPNLSAAPDEHPLPAGVHDGKLDPFNNVSPMCLVAHSNVNFLLLLLFFRIWNCAFQTLHRIRSKSKRWTMACQNPNGGSHFSCYQQQQTSC